MHRPLDQSGPDDSSALQAELAFLRKELAARDLQVQSLMEETAQLRASLDAAGDGADTPDAPKKSKMSAQLEPLAEFRQRTLGSMVLIAADHPPTPDRSSGGLRLSTIISLLSQPNRRLAFVSQIEKTLFERLVGGENERIRYEQLLKSMGVEKVAYGRARAEKLLRAYRGKLGFAFLSFPSVAHDLIPMVRRFAPWATVAFDMVDMHALRMEREAEIRGGHLKAAADEMAATELACARLADVTIAISDNERRLLLERDGSLSVSVIGNAFEFPELDNGDPRERKDILFVGGFRHTPNVDAMCWFVAKIWPLVRERLPDVSLNIVGADAPKKITELDQNAGINVLGFVQDLGDLYRSSRLSIAPLRIGAGVKGKIGQSLAWGLPAVTTSIGAEGFGAVHGEDFLVADSEGAFADAVVRLSQDDDLWKRLRWSGRKLVEKTHSIEAMRARLAALTDG